MISRRQFAAAVTTVAAGAVVAATLLAGSFTGAQAQSFDWRKHFSSEVSYRVINIKRGRLNVRTAPRRTARIVARLRPGTGGIMLKTCRSKTWCRIEVSLGARKVVGWVNMRFLGGYAS